MASWLTTHYPHYSDEVNPWYIHLQDKHKQAVAGIAVGDQVFFYEFKGGMRAKGRPPRPLGREGIVRIGTVSGPPYRHDKTISYRDGTMKDWSWNVPVDEGDTEGFVPRIKANEVLGFSPNYTLRGFGGGTGVMRITKERAELLLQLFKS